MESIDLNKGENLLDRNLDWGGNPICLDYKNLDNEFAQLVQDLLEKRI